MRVLFLTVFTKVPLSNVALRLHEPHPSSLTRPFIIGCLEGADFGQVILDYLDDDYTYAHKATFLCLLPAAPHL
jgi:hypothetical protein